MKCHAECHANRDTEQKTVTSDRDASRARHPFGVGVTMSRDTVTSLRLSRLAHPEGGSSAATQASRSFIVMQVGTGRVDGWYFDQEDAWEMKRHFDSAYPTHQHRVLEAKVDVPWFPLSAAKNDLRMP